MPPRKTRASIDAQATSVESEAGPSSLDSRPVKKARKSDEGVAAVKPPSNGSTEESRLAQASSSQPPQPPQPSPPPSPNAHSQPQPSSSSIDASPPPPPPADIPPPPPPTGEVAPAPPSPSPPPPPPPADDVDDGVDAEIQDAEYWERIAREGKQSADERSRDLYLDTVNRSLLDFDFEKLCSVCLSNINVYACLVCGKYFQGRGPKSYAYFHAINDGHRVYMNLETAKVYILPDNYEIADSQALADVKYLLQPVYSAQHIRRLDAPDARLSVDLQGKLYRPGFVGLNNIGGNDYINVVIQALAHVTPLRNFLLAGDLRSSEPSRAAASLSTTANAKTSGGHNPVLANSTELVRRFAALVRKVWNPRAFKAQVSPHEFLQEVNTASKGRFRLMEQGDPVEFLGWLLNRLHLDLNGGSRKKSSIISNIFQGQVRIESQKVYVRTGLEADDADQQSNVDKLDSDGRKEGGQEDEQGNAKFNLDRQVTVDRSPFFMLSIDLPPPPVFQDVVEKNIIPQVSLASVLAKYDGVTFQEAQGMIRRYKVTRLPPYVVLHFKRFTKNNFVDERNPTVVRFPITGLDLADYVDQSQGAGAVAAPTPELSTLYDLVSNVTHEATPGTVRDNSVWRAQVHTRIDGEPVDGSRNAVRGRVQDGEDEVSGGDGGGGKAEEKWYQTQDLFVEEVNRQMLFLQESYVQIWKRRDAV